MAIPIHLQQFKAAGIYRVVFDKSTIVNYDTELLRLVVGYSEQGPFNTPVYVKDPQTFIAMFGSINKKLEKRGIFFHRLALQMLGVSPILVLNLKKFENEKVDAASINTDFNTQAEIINTVKLKVEDIYDTTRFWTLDADKLNDIRAYSKNAADDEGPSEIMDQYINIATTNTKKTSATIFIRKASGSKVSQYNITVNDWYVGEDLPDYMQKYKNNLISDFFAEIYVFAGKFTASQVLASDTLKNYFLVTEEEDGGEKKQRLQLRNYILDAYGEPADTLDVMYADETSHALGHYVGAIIPEFKNKNNSYVSLDVAFNSDIDIHNMMMSFNTEMLYEYETANIDLSGRTMIVDDIDTTSQRKTLNLEKLFGGSATTSLLGNENAPVVTDTLSIDTNIYKNGKVYAKFDAKPTYISGTMYVTAVSDGSGDSEGIPYIALKQIGEEKTVQVNYSYNPETKSIDTLDGPKTIYQIAEEKFGVVFKDNGEGKYTEINSGHGTGWTVGSDPFVDNSVEGPEKVIISIKAIESDQHTTETLVYFDANKDLKVNLLDVQYETTTTFNNSLFNPVYGSSITFIPNNWDWKEIQLVEGITQSALVSKDFFDHSLLSILQKGDCILAPDNTVDYDGDEEVDEANNCYDTVYVQDMGRGYDYSTGTPEEINYILLTGEPTSYEHTNDDDTTTRYLVRVDAPLNQEIGVMEPLYFEGYTYMSGRPDGTGMWAKEQWQKKILSVLTDYKGLRTGLLNKSEIDYRYVIDTFQSFPDESIKQELAYLCKQKQSAFCIANFPAVQTFTKCPYASFTDSKGVFDVNYVVKGCNKKKAASVAFSMPDDTQGASFIAFYTPLKFSDGYLDSIVPSAGLVSNLFIEKYMTRQPYYIVAGPNYGRVYASGMVGPDYKYSMDELQIIEPYGVNCMVYRPSFGTFINANQTAKQIPLSALSKVHVRELVIYLMDEIEKVLQAYQWEFNNARTREAILSRANDICARVMANGGLQAYLNIMDESNNTPEIIDNEMAVLSTHIEPGMGCGKMVHELTLYRTGQMMSAINEG